MLQAVCLMLRIGRQSEGETNLGNHRKKKAEITRKILDTWKEEEGDNDGKQPHTATFPLRLRGKVKIVGFAASPRA